MCPTARVRLVCAARISPSGQDAEPVRYQCGTSAVGEVSVVPVRLQCGTSAVPYVWCCLTSPSDACGEAAAAGALPALVVDHCVMRAYRDGLQTADDGGTQCPPRQRCGDQYVAAGEIRRSATSAADCPHVDASSAVAVSV